MSPPPTSPPHASAVAGLLQRVSWRLHAVAVARRTYLLMLFLAAAYLALLLGARLLAVVPDVFTPPTILAVPLLAALLATLICRRADARAAARRADAALETHDLFLTATLVDESPGAYRPLVTRDAEARAVDIDARRVVPFEWAPRARTGVVLMCGLWLCALLVPQLDPFGREEARAQQGERRKELKETRTATTLRKAQLQQQKGSAKRPEVQSQLESLKKAFEGMKPNDQKGNFDRLTAEQQQLGKLWRKVSAERLKHAAARQMSKQNFGALSERTGEWKRQLREGNTAGLQSEMDALQKLARRAADAKDPAERRRLNRQLKQRLSELADFAARDLKSMPMNAALSRALDQLKMGSLPELSQEALEALMDTMKLAQLELDQTQLNLDDLRALEDALKALQLAQQANNLKGLDGAQGQGGGIQDYAELYESIMGQGQCQGCGQGNCPGGGRCPGNGNGMGMGGPGQGEGGQAPEDDSLENDFKTEKEKAAFRAGKILMQWQSDEFAERGKAREDYVAQAQRVKQGVNEAILKEQIPPGYHDGIQQYFDAIQPPKAAGAPPDVP